MSGNLRDAESPKAFSDAKPAISLQKPILLAVISVSAGYLFGSVSLSAVLLLGLVIECFSDVIVGNILMPPFADNRPPSEGLTEKVGKVCPYWPKDSVRGPKFMGLRYEDVEFPTSGGATVRGWCVPLTCPAPALSSPIARKVAQPLSCCGTLDLRLATSVDAEEIGVGNQPLTGPCRHVSLCIDGKVDEQCHPSAANLIIHSLSPID